MDDKRIIFNMTNSKEIIINLYITGPLLHQFQTFLFFTLNIDNINFTISYALQRKMLKKIPYLEPISCIVTFFFLVFDFNVTNN